MYKNISFQEAEFGEKKFLMYRVDDAAQMDHVEVEMLKNNDIKGLLPFSSAQNNDEIKFMYEMTNKMKLSQFLGGLVRWEELYPAVQGIIAAIMDCAQYMLNEGHFVLEAENIFIDLSSRKIELMFLPVENELLAHITWKDFLITLLHNLNYDMKDDIGKLETLQSYLADEKITLKEYAEKIEKIKTLGFARNKDVKKENKQSERPVREVKMKEKPNVIYNVPDPNSEISSDVMKTEKEEKKEGIIGLFSKKKKKEKKPKKEGEPEIEEIPSYFADTVLNSMFFSYLEYRKENGKEVKGKAIGYCIDKLESLSNSPVEQVAIIKQTIQNGWTDFFPVKEKKEKEKKSGSNVSSWLEREKIQSTGGVFGD